MLEAILIKIIMTACLFYMGIIVLEAILIKIFMTACLFSKKEYVSGNIREGIKIH